MCGGVGVCVYIDIYIYLYIHTHPHPHTPTQTMEYYSAIKKNEITLFVATWMDLEIIILSEVGQTKTNIV